MSIGPSVNEMRECREGVCKRCESKETGKRAIKVIVQRSFKVQESACSRSLMALFHNLTSRIATSALESRIVLATPPARSTFFQALQRS